MTMFRQALFYVCEGILDISSFGEFVKNYRGKKGIRAAANEIGISHPTLSRIENGHVPDLEKFSLICKWLGENPSRFLGEQLVSEDVSSACVHFKKKNTTSIETATAIGEMIIATQQALRDRELI